MGLIKVSDMPKGKDDLPHCRNHQYYYPVHSSRELYSSFAPSGDAEKDAAVLKWTPQGQRYVLQYSNHLASLSTFSWGGE